MFSSDYGATVMQRIFCHDRGRIGTRATWWSAWCAVGLDEDRATVETISDRLCVPLDVAQRAVASLAGIGLLDVSASGEVSRAHVVHVAHAFSGSSPVTTRGELLPAVPVANHLEQTCATRDGLLSWQVPAIVMSSGFLPIALDLCAYMAEQVAERGDSSADRRATSKAWVLPMEAILRTDKREPDQVRRVLDWLHAGQDDVAGFWRQNVLSPSSLRSRWERMAHQYAAKKRQRPSRQAQILTGDGGPRLADVLGGRG